MFEMTVLKGYIIGAVYAAVCLLIATILYKLGIDKKYTRKFVHIFIGFEWVILNYFIGASYHLLIICLAFLALLIAVHKTGRMKMISSDGENSPGTVYFCVSMSLMSLAVLLETRFMLPFGIAVFCTSFGDGLAGVAGSLVKKHNPRIWRSKTLVGTLAAFLASLVITLMFLLDYVPERAFLASLGISTLVAFFAAEMELFTGFGLDNVTLPVGVSVLSYFLVFYTGKTLDFIVPILLTPLLLAVVVRKKLLTPFGTVLAVLLDLAVSAAFGNAGFLMMITFLFGGVLIDKVKERVKKSDSEARIDRSRDSVQVLANGLPAFVMCIMYLITLKGVFFVAFAAAVAEAFADTAGSGFGVLSRRTVDVFRVKRAEQGMSGGMSLVGTSASLVGAALVAVIPVFFGLYGLNLAALVFAAAFLGSVFDSFLGSVFQVKYRCTVCGKLTERERHCDAVTKKESGFTFVDNNFVNLASGLFSAAVAIAVHFIF